MDINICFGINNDFCQHCGVTMASILKNSDKKDTYKFFIFSDFISEENKNKFNELKNIRDFDLEFYILDMSEFQELKASNTLGPSAFYRLKAFEILPVDKILYLDSDIVVRKDIKEFYKTNLNSYCCAAVEDLVAPEKIKKMDFPTDMNYFNSGVLLLNLQYCKQEKIADKIKDFIQNSWTEEWNDQELLNYLFYRKVKMVDFTWNYQCYRSMYKDQQHYNEVGKNPAVIHYVFVKKPWLAEMMPPYKSEYFKYLKLTPWFDDFFDLYMIEENIKISEKTDIILNILSSITRPR